MNRRERKRLASRYAQAMLVLERKYYRAIRRMYRDWLNRLIGNLAKALDDPEFRMDADDDDYVDIDGMLPGFEVLKVSELTSTPEQIKQAKAVEKFFNDFNLSESIQTTGSEVVAQKATRQLASTFSRAEKLEPVFKEALLDLTESVQRFSVSMSNVADDVSKLSNMVFTKENPVDLLVRPLIREPWLEAELKDFAVENSRLITKMGQETTDRIASAALDTLKKSEGRGALAKKIQEIDATIGENKAKLVARNELGKLQSNLTEIRAERAGVEEYEWQTAGDNKVRPKHEKLDGTTRKFGEGIAPGEEINCRCVAIPKI